MSLQYELEPNHELGPPLAAQLVTTPYEFILIYIGAPPSDEA